MMMMMMMMKKMCYDQRYLRTIGLYVLCVTTILPTCVSSCGGYVTPGVDESGTIASPNYPSNYNRNTQCIWLLEAQSGYAVSLTVNGVSGDPSCTDYLEIRNGSSEQTVELYECSSAVVQTVQARWLWIKFYSNYVDVSTGFTASWSVVTDSDTSSLSSPFVDCPMEYRCGNKECVARAYMCDGYSDCGCEDSNCDEGGCRGLNLSMAVKIGIGVGVGVGFFIITFFGIGLLDICLKKRAENKYKARIERQKKLQKQKKAKAMAALFVTQPSTDGSRNSGSVTGSSLRVPSASTIYASTTNVKT